jgi:hypothetical protein
VALQFLTQQRLNEQRIYLVACAVSAPDEVENPVRQLLRAFQVVAPALGNQRVRP